MGYRNRRKRECAGLGLCWYNDERRRTKQEGGREDGGRG